MNEMTNVILRKGDFMKRQLTVALGLLVIAPAAFATKARLEALGEDSFGSYYIQDNRNIFLNPARINENKDFVTYEFGASGNNIAAADSAKDPRAVGGFVKSVGNMAYGLHFGDSSTSTGAFRAASGGNLQERQPWDFHIGGDAGVKWGASFTYEEFNGRTGTGNVSGNRLTSHGTKVRGGVLMGDLDLFAQISLANKASDDQGHYVKGDMGTFLGAGYMMNNYKLFLDWRMINGDYKGGATASKKSADTSIWRAGVGRQERLNDRATLFAKAMIVRNVIDDNGSNITAGNYTSYAVPLNVGIEYAATSWLDLRASVSQNVWSKSENKLNAGGRRNSNINNTAVRAGASLKFGEFSIDGLVSTDQSANGQATNTDASTDQGGAIRTDSLMTRVAMIYRF
jgi:hypothetical protein